MASFSLWLSIKTAQQTAKSSLSIIELQLNEKKKTKKPPPSLFFKKNPFFWCSLRSVLNPKLNKELASHQCLTLIIGIHSIQTQKRQSGKGGVNQTCSSISVRVHSKGI
jgi:hypothetical protein